MELFYEKPAGRWEETLPIGNGKLGGMIWGIPQKEMIGMNQDTLWSGYVRPEYAPRSPEVLQEVRELIFAGRGKEAERLMNQKLQGIYTESYLPLGNLYLEDHSVVGPVRDYRRSLSLDEAISHTAFHCGGVEYKREYFASYPANVVIIRLEASKPVMELTVSMESQLHCRFDALEGGFGIRFTGKCPEHVDPSYLGEKEDAIIWGSRGMDFSGNIRVLDHDGEIVYRDGKLVFSHSSVIVLSYDAVEESILSDVGEDSDNRELYAAVRQKHIADYKSIYDKVTIDLGVQMDIPTDMRLEALKRGETDPGLYGLYFQYGRYLMISCSRKGSQPANLQGIWNWEMRAPWSSNFTTNINFQMNYWPVFSCGLEECAEPYFDLLDRVIENGKSIARNFYHCRGAVLHHNTDYWAVANPVGVPYGQEVAEEASCMWSVWPMGLGWAIQTYYTYYEYTLDEEFLRKRAYPAFREASLFYVDWLIMHDGHYTTCPSTSPENQYIDENGVRGCLTDGSAMDMEIIEETFRTFQRICGILHISDDLLPEIEERLDLLKPVAIGCYGQILEWTKEYEEFEGGHRHLSHLYGMFPSELWENDERMREAARISLKHRLDSGSGHTGWSCAWVINMLAVLGDREGVGKFLQQLLTKSTYPNLWDAHEPFQIDGNFGGIAGIANMLVQDRGGRVKYKRAMPEMFPTGSVKGLRIKGNQSVDLTW